MNYKNCSPCVHGFYGKVMVQEKAEQPYLQDFLWQIPNLEQKQYLVLDQEKLPIDLNISSTDTTAISSFALSIIIALILGCLATWLAYWYGRKSFQLTEMSFKAVIAEINSSKSFMVETNANFVQKQNDLRLSELEINSRKDAINILRMSVYEYISVIQNFKYYYIQNFYYRNRGLIFDKQTIRYQELFITNKEKIGEFTYKVFINFNPVDEEQFNLQVEMMELLSISHQMLPNEVDEFKFKEQNHEFGLRFERILFKLRLMLQL